MEFWLRVHDGRVFEVSFATDGCGPSLACGSIATVLAKGLKVEDVSMVQPRDILNALGGLPEEVHHCARLTATTLRDACREILFRGGEMKGTEAKPADGCTTCDKESCSAKQQREGEEDQEYADRRLLQKRLCRIEHKVLVLSGKGGVGKSTVAVNLAVALSLAGKRVGLLDVDIHGPSVPKMLQIENASVETAGGFIAPVEVGGTKVMSIGLLLRDQDDAVIWRGPMKMGVIKQFLKDVEWGDLDYLVVDSPPGTGDEPLSVCQLIEDADGAIVVTTPQDVATTDVRKCVTFCRKLELPVLGVIENMSGFVCPKCGEVTAIFRSGGGERMANEMGVPFLGSIPVDPAIGAACDDGTPFLYHQQGTDTAKAMQRAIRPILELPDAGPAEDAVTAKPIQQKEGVMRIAIPAANGQLAMHFGHCEKFALVDVDPDAKSVTGTQELDPPAHEPGVLPRWLAENSVNLVIAGGMGMRAQQLFAQSGIEVLVGAPSEAPESIVSAYLEGTLEVGENVCDH